MPLASQVQRWLRDIAFSIFEYFQASENTILIILALVIGILGGLGAVGFRAMIMGFQWITIHRSGTIFLQHLNTLPWYYLLILPALGGLVVGPLVHFFAREAKGHGTREDIEQMRQALGA